MNQTNIYTVDSIEQLCAVIENIDKTPTDHVRIELADGIYPVTETLILQNLKFSEGLWITAQNGVKPVLDGSISLEADRFQKEKDYFVYQFEADEAGNMPVFHDFYDNGKKIPICKSRYSVLKNPLNDGEDPSAIQGLFVEEALVKETAFPAEFQIFVEWEYHMIHATGVDYTQRVDRDGVPYVLVTFAEEELRDFIHYHHRMLSLENRLVCFSNHASLLKKGTWAYDKQQGRLYYAPKDDIVKAPAYSILKTLLEIKDCANIHIEGITFTGTGCVEPAEYGYFSAQANTERRYGLLSCSGILISNTEHISIQNCAFDQLGSNGIQTTEALEDCTIQDCIFSDVTMSAIVIGSRVLHHPTQTWNDLKVSKNCRILNNLIEHIGMEFPTCPGIVIAKIDGLKILHNTIRDVAYSGISIGWRWAMADFELGEDANIKDTEVAYNRIEDFMKMLRDGGAVYVVGGNSKIEHTELFNTMHDNVAVRPLDSEEGNCSRGYYLDEASTNWHLYQNIISGAIRPLFIQYVVKVNPCYNNLVQQTYSTTPVSELNAVPERNIIVEDTHMESSLEAILQTYPQAREVYEKAGSTLDTMPMVQYLSEGRKGQWN